MAVHSPASGSQFCHLLSGRPWALQTLCKPVTLFIHLEQPRCLSQRGLVSLQLDNTYTGLTQSQAAIPLVCTPLSPSLHSTSNPQRLVTSMPPLLDGAFGKGQGPCRHQILLPENVQDGSSHVGNAYIMLTDCGIYILSVASRPLRGVLTIQWKSPPSPDPRDAAF